jgi:hypothetical protein
MDFPAAEKCYSHVSQRRPSDSSESDLSPSSSKSSPAESRPRPFAFESYDRALTPQISSATARPVVSREITVTKTTTAGTTITLDPSFEVDFEDDDPEDPRNWPLWYKAFTLFAVSYGTLMIVLYSTTYTAAISAMMEEFNVQSEAIVTLGVTTYLLGLAVGSLFLAPISETYGRKPVYTIAMFFFIILIIPCTVVDNITTIIVFRFFGAVAGSAMIANAPGTVGDIISDKYRATAFSIWSIGPMNGPVFGMSLPSTLNSTNNRRPNDRWLRNSVRLLALV